MFPSQAGRTFPKQDWHNCSQARPAQLFPSEIGTIVPKLDWHNCSQVTLAPLFPNETGMIVPKWDWRNCSQVRLAWLFSSETGTIVPKWDWHNYSWILLSSLYFVLQCAHYSMQFARWCHVPGLWHMIQILYLSVFGQYVKVALHGEIFLIERHLRILVSSFTLFNIGETNYFGAQILKSSTD